MSSTRCVIFSDSQAALEAPSKPEENCFPSVECTWRPLEPGFLFTGEAVQIAKRTQGEINAAHHARRPLCVDMPCMKDSCLLVPDVRIFMYHLSLPSINRHKREGSKDMNVWLNLSILDCSAGVDSAAVEQSKHISLRNHHFSHTKFH